MNEGEQIHISSWGHTVNLASKMAIECYKNDAIPLITLTTDNLFDKIVTDIPVEMCLSLYLERKL